MNKIGREIKSINLQEHYKSQEIVWLVNGVWAWYLITLTFAISMLFFVGILTFWSDTTVAICARSINNAAYILLSWMKLYLLMNFSAEMDQE